MTSVKSLAKPPSLPPIFKEYCSYLTTYKETHGDKTIVLMQVGSFYEIYAYLQGDQELGETSIYHICQNIMNIAVAKKTNQILMGGFQVPYAQKFIKLLIDDNYSVVLVTQVTEPPNPERKVTEIISPGTYLEGFKDTNNYMMSVYIEGITDTFVSVGISIIDISTGKNYIYQIGENLDHNYWKDELHRLLTCYNPRECLFQLQNIQLTYDDIINYWDINEASIQINHYTDSCYHTITYQNELLQKVFQFTNSLSAIENLHMVHNNEQRISYIYMLQYIYEHKVDIVRNIDLPEDIDNIHYLSLTSNSVRQLNVVSNYSYYKGKNESLLSITDECGSVGGRRLLKERLIYPSISPELLQKRYDKIDLLIQDHSYKDIKGHISKLSDLDRLLRKMGLGLLEPAQFMNMKLSYDFMNRVIADVASLTELATLYSEYDPIVDTYKQFYDKITKLFNFASFYETESSYFLPGHYQDIDALQEKINQVKHNLQLIAQRLSGIVEIDSSCKVDSNDKYGYFLYCTKKRSKILDKRFQNIPNHVINIRDNHEIIYEIPALDFCYKPKDTQNVFIECSEINDLTSKLHTYVSELTTLNQVRYNEVHESLYSEYHEALRKLHYYIADLDISTTAAKLSIHNKYCKPCLRDHSKSYLSARDIRHPIVERISVDTEYITNDITLGDGKDGMLLFGTNACGKSTLMKAVGLSVIMAQAGLYVPCSSFEFKPYTKIFTRILNNDNIFRSQSSFAVEMMELRSIFTLSDENSLILGDELCSGTETLSAISIVSKSLDILSAKKASYIITSHLHQLNEIPLVRELPNVDIYHLQITNDDGILTYDRKLKEGAGPAIYGLKVCEAMGLSSSFIHGANCILRDLVKSKHTLIDSKKSQYNSQVFMDECKVCQGGAEETHHIKEQRTADSDGMIDHHHKHNKHNLVPLCKSCHDKVTYGSLRIYGWKQTSRGPILDYETIVTDKPCNPSKHSPEEVTIMLSYKDNVRDGDMNYVTCMNLLDAVHGFRPSRKVLKDLFT